jgi:DNA modification methylase
MAVEEVARSIKELGFNRPLVVSEKGKPWKKRTICVGHTAFKAAQQLELAEVPVLVVRMSKDQFVRYNAADNKTAELAEWDMGELGEIMRDFELTDIPGFTQEEFEGLLAELDTQSEPSSPSLSDRFIVPPFSVLDARKKYWQDRKNEWLALGIDSAKGREENLLKFSKLCGTQSSIFNPVLCELAYRWFCVPGGIALDPFAGGSVRGVVAALLGYKYIGVDLRQEQIEENVAQWGAVKKVASTLLPKAETPKWIVGDSLTLNRIIKQECDFIFSCPPYYDLERYSEDPADISNADTYGAFLEAYAKIIANAASLLKANRFACFVVGDIRNEEGIYRDFVSHTIDAFSQCDLALYNHAILVTPVGHLRFRAPKMFTTSRKLASSHQHVLVFVKGDPRKAANAIPVDEESLKASLEIDAEEAELQAQEMQT